MNDYPPDWPMIAGKVKLDAGWRCLRCKHPHESPLRRIPCDSLCDLTRHPEVAGAVEVEFDLHFTFTVYYKEPQKQRVLTVHHLDGDKANIRWWNLVALCQVCHLIIQAKVVLPVPDGPVISIVVVLSATASTRSKIFAIL